MHLRNWPREYALANFGLQLKTFKANIGSYPTLGATALQVTDNAADCDYFNYTSESPSILKNDAKAWTAWRDATRNGNNSAATPPAATALPASVTAVAPGVEARFRALVQQIKGKANYNVTIGTVLGIEGTTQAPPDMATVQPLIDATTTAGGVIIGWGFAGQSAFLDALELEVDRNDSKGFVNLTIDSTPTTPT